MGAKSKCDAAKFRRLGPISRGRSVISKGGLMRFVETSRRNQRSFTCGPPGCIRGSLTVGVNRCVGFRPEMGKPNIGNGTPPNQYPPRTRAGSGAVIWNFAGSLLNLRGGWRKGAETTSGKSGQNLTIGGGDFDAGSETRAHAKRTAVSTQRENAP